MDLRKHGVAVAVALAAFIVLTLLGGAWSPAAWYAVLAIMASTLALYWHYRRRSVKRARIRAAVPTIPGRDDRVIPQSVKNEVALRDKGLCQIKGPPCVVGGTVWDHKVPYSWGGSSKTASNIQQACDPCNNWKSDNFADTDAGRITYEEWKYARV